MLRITGDRVYDAANNVNGEVRDVSVAGGRMDEVPPPLRPPLRSPYPTDEDVIKRIHHAVAKKAVWESEPGRAGQAT
jgi:hypothetical protein